MDEMTYIRIGNLQAEIADPIISQNSPHTPLTRLFGRERKELPCALAHFYAPIAIGLQLDSTTDYLQPSSVNFLIFHLCRAVPENITLCTN
jgi:hypothetical protein